MTLLKRLHNFLIILLFLLCFPLTLSAQSGIFPSNIQVIMEKLQNGNALSTSEEKALTEWSASMQQNKEDPISEVDSLSESQASTPEFQSIKTDICPKEKKPASVYSKPMNRKDYLDFLHKTAILYSKRDGDGQRKVDELLKMAQNDSDGADLGAVLLTMGAGSAAAYATTWTALRNPDDVLTANNLGVILKGLDDYGRALQVLKHADEIKPDSFLVTINIAWVFYETGDFDQAEAYFNKAKSLDISAASPKLGLGLIAECRGQHALAEQLLKEALAKTYSIAGAAAMIKARQADSGSEEQPREPLGEKRISGREIQLPDLPISQNIQGNAGAGQGLEDLNLAMDERIRELTEDIASLSRTVAAQQKRANQNPESAVVLYRDFSRELFMFDDCTNLLFGKHSRISEALKKSRNHMDTLTSNLENSGFQFMRDMDTVEIYFEEVDALTQKADNCGSEECLDAVKKEIDAVTYKMEQLSHNSCRRKKVTLETAYVEKFQAWKVYMDAVQEAGRDYYAFTSPLLEKIYSPSLNELLNAKRELRILTHYKIAVGMSLELPEMADAYYQLICVPPQERQPEDPCIPESRQRKPKPCPFQNPLSLKVIVVSFELDCEKVRVEAGEGLLVSLQRDFIKHETTIGVGVGAEFHGPVAEGGAKMGVEIKIQGDNLTDVGFSSSVSSKVGVLESELSGRWSMEAGPSVDLQTKLSLGTEQFNANL